MIRRMTIVARKILGKVSHRAGDYLTYNKTEQRGILVMGLLLLAVIAVKAVIPAGTLQKRAYDAAFTAEVISFEKEWRRASDSDSIARASRYRERRYRSDSLKPYASFPGHKEKPIVMVDLNRADTLDLQQLRGIGPAFARRIVSYRDRLGGFVDSKQLLEVFGMDSARLRAIRANLVIPTDSIRKIDLNAVTFKELLRHPYFPFAMTKKIMVFRQKNKVFRNLDELRNIEGISDSVYRRIIVYLRLGP